jgi:hypothetical protein
MRNTIGAGLIGLSYVSGLIFGLWALILDAGILLTAGGVLLLLAGLFLFPFAMTIAPFYAGVMWGDWHPLRVTIAGALMMPIFMAIGTTIMRKR